MPQRQFFTRQIACRVNFTLHEHPTDPTKEAILQMTVFDQEGAPMIRATHRLPKGFVPWSMADCVKAGMEAYSVGTPKEARAAFLRTAAAWCAETKNAQLPA